MAIGAYCRRDVATIDAGASLQAAAQKMREENVGCLVVTERGRTCAVVTDRDLALRTLREGIDAGTATLADFVERSVVVVNADRPVRLAIMLMRKYGIRRLPVLDDRAQLVGLVTWDDMVGLLARELSEVAAMLATQSPHLSVPPSRSLVELASEGEVA